MRLDYEVNRSRRECAETGKSFKPGEKFFSTLLLQPPNVIRKDYSKSAWNGPSEDAIAWWACTVSGGKSAKENQAPSEVMLELFDQLAEEPGQQDTRYVLTLFMVRRKIFRFEEVYSLTDSETEVATDSLQVYCAKRDKAYEVSVVRPTAERIRKIENQLAKILGHV